MNYEFHPIADTLPLLGDAELHELAEDIKANGLIAPIVIHDNKILDGRNRYRACAISGTEPRFEVFRGGSPAAFVVSSNLKRRHLTPSQKAAAAVEMLPWFEKEAKARLHAGQKSGGRGKKNSTPKIEGSSGESAAIAGKEFGVSRAYVAEAKAIKEKAPEQFEAIKRGDKTITEVKRKMRVDSQRAAIEQKIKDREHAPTATEVPGIVLADPPWAYDFAETDNRQIDNHYPTATVAEIVSHRPETTTNAVLFLWATAPKLTEALEVLTGWGFSYRTHCVWDKEKIGMGYWFRGQHELLLVAVRGEPELPLPEFRVGSVFREARRQHSKKPECVYGWIESAFPHVPKLEMYCRSPRVGWSTWGNEA